MRQVKMTRDSFHVFQANARNALKQSEQVPSILICAGPGCIGGGARKFYDNLKTECDTRGLPVVVGRGLATDAAKSLHVKMSGCHGFCEMGPLVHIEPMGVMYIHVKPEDCHEILEKTVLGGEIIDRLVYHLDGVAYPRQEDIPFYKKQHRVVLENCGSSDAEDIEEYIAKGGYAGFEKALFEMTDEEICRSIIDSGLRGRGGGGFPAGQKWDGARKQKSEKKYIVCNGDEGDPGAFMDRSIMEGNPHSVLEGMMIAGRAVGSDEGYIYVRAEYPLAVSRLKAAIAKAEEYGLLGDHVMGTDFSFRIHVNMGAGAFVCGEGSALTASIEGNRGMPRVKPPRTIEHGLWAEPTVLNNVETFANVPLIIRKGVDWYRSIGTKTSPGTKAFALTGNVVNTGLIEVPMGTTIREVVFDIGGGTGAATIFGTTGGVAEAVARRVVEDKSKNTLQAIQFSGIRGSETIRAVTLPVGDRALRIAVVHGLVNAQKLLDDIESGQEYFDLVEVMTCKTGCVGGAGQPYGLIPVKQQRAEGLYEADRTALIKRSERNPIVTKLLEGAMKGRTHQLLHVEYKRPDKA